MIIFFENFENLISRNFFNKNKFQLRWRKKSDSQFFNLSENYFYVVYSTVANENKKIWKIFYFQKIPWAQFIKFQQTNLILADKSWFFQLEFFRALKVLGFYLHYISLFLAVLLFREAWFAKMYDTKK